MSDPVGLNLFERWQWRFAWESDREDGSPQNFQIAPPASRPKIAKVAFELERQERLQVKPLTVASDINKQPFFIAQFRSLAKLPQCSARCQRGPRLRPHRSKWHDAGYAGRWRSRGAPDGAPRPTMRGNVVILHIYGRLILWSSGMKRPGRNGTACEPEILNPPAIPG